jgi:PDDEXK-like uncharacterized protein DUF3799
MTESLTSQNGDALPHAIGDLILDLPFDQYRAADGINSHGLLDLLRSPAHYWERRYNHAPEKNSDALLFGRLLHLAVLEPDRFLKDFKIEPEVDKRTTVGKNTLADFYASIPQTAIVVPHKAHGMLARMAERIAKNDKAAWLLKDSVREASVFWFDNDTGELCKGRADAISSGGILIDVKTTVDARYRKFGRQAFDMGYHVQSAHYTAGGTATGKMRGDSFVFLVIEKTPPYEVAVYPASPSFLATGRKWRHKAMATYTECRKNNVYPGYNPDALELDLPDYAESVAPEAA